MSEVEKKEGQDEGNGKGLESKESPKSNNLLELLSPEEKQALIAELKKEVLGNVVKVATQVDVEDVTDPNDALDEPVIFFTFSQGRSIMDDKRNNRIVLPPGSYKNEEGKMITMPYRFVKLFFTEKFNTRNRRERVWVSVCKEYSKKRVEWLRKHTMFGTMFFEDIKAAQSVDNYIQEKLVEGSLYVQRMNDAQVIERCRNAKLTISKDVHEMRRELARKISYDNMNHETDKVKKAAISSYMAEHSKVGGALKDLKDVRTPQEAFA